MAGRIPLKLRKIIRAVLFCAVFLVLLMHVSYILRPYSGSASRKNICGFYAEPQDSLDVVFVGSSSVFAFWEPMEFWEDYGVASYNFAAGTMPPQFIRDSIEEIRKTQSPELFVVDLRPFTVAENGYYLETDVANMDHDVPIRNVVDNFKYSLDRFRVIDEGIPEEYDRLPYFFDIIKYHTEWPRLFDAQSLAFWRNESHDSLKGFKLVDKVKKVKFYDQSEVTERREMTERLNGTLSELLDYCRDEDLDVLFLVNSYCQKKKEKKVYNYIADVVAEYGFDFLNTNDYYEEIGLDYETDYYDQSHVNIFGADKYTEFVGNYIMSHWELPDHRGEDAYASWDEDYLAWTEQTEALKESIQAKIEAR